LLAEIAAYITAGVVSLVARDLNPPIEYTRSFRGQPNQSYETPRAILDMKLGGSDSELDGHGHRSFFVPDALRPAAASVVVESLECLREARGFFVIRV
jgi:hypothetical protein